MFASVIFLLLLGELEAADCRDAADWSVSSKSVSTVIEPRPPGPRGGLPSGSGGGASPSSSGHLTSKASIEEVGRFCVDWCKLLSEGALHPEESCEWIVSSRSRSTICDGIEKPPGPRGGLPGGGGGSDTAGSLRTSSPPSPGALKNGNMTLGFDINVASASSRPSTSTDIAGTAALGNKGVTGLASSSCRSAPSKGPAAALGQGTSNEDPSSDCV
mmetsp:Transcript_75124/g.174209  ORF Transcript_75124/g.174209 Transcript_75124/m.174209 type:complete len:216 (+) Transcript_75124:477-1124(+)